MKYEGTRPSGEDKDIPLYKFVVGKAEMILLKGILSDAMKRMPKIIETEIIFNRLRNMRKVLEKTLNDL